MLQLSEHKAAHRLILSLATNTNALSGRVTPEKALLNTSPTKWQGVAEPPEITPEAITIAHETPLRHMCHRLRRRPGS